MMTANDRARAGFAAHFGFEPDGVVFAPGRVNLIGEHVDYNDGLVLPMPISAGTAVAWAKADEPAVDAVALDLGPQTDRFDLAQTDRPDGADWRAYLRGMAATLPPRGVAIAGAKLAIAGSLPRGSGLSSSASLCVAAGRALAAAGGAASPPARELALAAQAAEHDWAGVHCGIMDQMVIAAGTPGAAFLLDCRDLTSRLVPLPSDWAIVIVQSGVRRDLVDGQYNARRDACATAAAALGVASLRDATFEMVATGSFDAEVRSRARHVVTEIARVARAVEAIAGADLQALGECLNQSHASLRDDFAVTVPPIDRLVAVLQSAIGAAGGARMTGAGFGGAAVAICETGAVESVREAVTRNYRCPDGSEAEISIETACAAGAGDRT